MTATGPGPLTTDGCAVELYAQLPELGEAALLSTARRHLRPGGTLVVQWHPPGWFETARSGAGGMLGPASVRLEGVTRSGELLSATVHYAIGTDEWTQTFVARRRDVHGLDEALHAAGFRRERWLSDDQTWFAASAE